MPRRFLSWPLLLLVPACGTPAPAPPARAPVRVLDEGTVPDLDSLELDLELVSAGQIRGKASLVLSEPARGDLTLALAREMKLLGLTDPAGQGLEWQRQGDRVICAAAGVTELRLRFEGTPRQGVWFENGPDGSPTRLGWASLSTEAGAWFPRSPNPADRALATLRLSLPAGWSGLASGERAGPGVFRVSEPVPVTTLALGAARGAELLVREVEGFELRVLARSDRAEELSARTLAALEGLSTATHAPPPWRSLALVDGGDEVLAGVGHAWVRPGFEQPLETLLVQAWIEGLGPTRPGSAPDPALLAEAWADQKPWLRQALPEGEARVRLARILGDWPDPEARAEWLDRLTDGEVEEQRLDAWHTRPEGPELLVRPRWDESSGKLLLSVAQTQEVGEGAGARTFPTEFVLTLGLENGDEVTRELSTGRRRQILEIELDQPVRWVEARLVGPGKVQVEQADSAWIEQASRAHADGLRAEALRFLAGRVRDEELDSEGLEFLAPATGPYSTLAALELRGALGEEVEEELLERASVGDTGLALEAAAVLRRTPPASRADRERRADWGRSRLEDADLSTDLRRAGAVILIGSDPSATLPTFHGALEGAGPALTRDLVQLASQIPQPAMTELLRSLLASSDPLRRYVTAEGLLATDSIELLADQVRALPDDSLSLRVREALARP